MGKETHSKSEFRQLGCSITLEKVKYTALFLYVCDMNGMSMTFGSVCSGIETASIAFTPLGLKPLWFSETAKFPSMLLADHYPNVPNYGDMRELPQKIGLRMIEAPDLLCGGTPCNSYSTLGKRLGLDDQRGGLSLTFTDIADSIDNVRREKGLDGCLILWENVEGILSDKGNAFGHFLYRLTGCEKTFNITKWSAAGIVCGRKRKAVWRVLDAAGFGLPQHRKRVFVIASANPSGNIAAVLFETGDIPPSSHKESRDYSSIIRKKGSKTIEIFSENTNCLYAAYSTKYNDRSANYGTLLAAENGRLRRFTPLECERLMGIPDNYTLINDVKGDSPRYQALGNAWAVNVVRWIAERFSLRFTNSDIDCCLFPTYTERLLLLDKPVKIGDKYLNASPYPYGSKQSSVFGLLESSVDGKYFLSKDLCRGILRRKEEDRAKMNPRLESLMKGYIADKECCQNAFLHNIGQKVRYHRKLNHLTQKDLADRTGLSLRYVIAIEQGKENISVLNLKAMADGLGVALSALIEE